MSNQYTKKDKRKEIFWNLINSGLAGGLVFLGSLSTGKITLDGFIFGLVAAGIVAITKFQSYWRKEERQYLTKLFNFIT